MSAAVQIWSTDAVPRKQRFAYWREVRARNIFGVTAEPDRNAADEFYGRFSAVSVGGASLGEMHASSYTVRRTEADIARAPNDSLCVYQQIEGASWFDNGRGSDFVVAAGQIALSYSDLPYETVPTTAHGFHLRILKIPFSRVRSFAPPESELTAGLLNTEPGIAALLGSYFSAFLTQAPYLRGQAAEAAVQTVAQLALAARGALAANGERSRAAVGAGRLQQAYNFVDQNLHRPELTPAIVAAALGMSPRLLHMLFEPTGTTFTRHLLARRIAFARAVLERHPARPVIDVALSCGIESSSVFYRAFRGAYGMTPTEFRSSLTGRR